MAAKAFADGRKKCTGNQHSLTLNRLEKLESATEKLLALSQVKSLGDPSDLPKELFSQIMISQDADTKINGLGVSKGWKNQLETESMLWRDVQIAATKEEKQRWSSGARSRSTKASIPTIIKLFALNSGDTLQSITLDFDLWELGAHKLHECFETLGDSSDTLKKIKFNGNLESANATFDAVTLAAKCTGLESFECVVRETFYVPDSPPGDGSAWEIDTQAGSQFYEMISFDYIKFNSFPTNIKIGSSDLSEIRIGSKLEFFKQAKYVDIDMTVLHQGNAGKDSPLNQYSVAELMKISSKSLKSLRITQNGSLIRKWGQLSKLTSIQVPKLRLLEIKIGKPRYSFYGSAGEPNDPLATPVALIAPKLKPETFSVTDGSFILKSGA